ncbi:serine hydrolase domain-containing protein [Luteococcus sp. Sow4_B9]|uniref:serine hydrolase domain-containing protein n=1 Tax=Luteococcus sp. Sow4_B9 TaxID=3438792 RepID=UPI003F96D1A8
MKSLPRRPLTAGLAAVACLALATPAAAQPGNRTVLDGLTRDQTAQQVAAAAQQAKQNHRKGHGARISNPTLDAALAQMVADGAVGVTGRLESSTTTWAGAAGLRDKDAKSKAKPNDRFRAASNTKMMISVLVLQEVQKGVWQLDQPVADVLPTLLPDHSEVTFRQLLSHTSGMPNGTNELLFRHITDPSSQEQFEAAVKRDYAPQEHIDAINDAPWTTPGEMLYSNAGFVALGMLLEAQNGTSLQTLLRERVFKPAGMHQTTFDLEPRLTGAALHEDGWLGEADGWMELDQFDPDLLWAAGAVTSTTADLNDFTRALFSGALVSPALVEQMMTPESGAPLHYGLGLYRITDPCPSDDANPYLYGHDGAALGTLSVAFSSPDGQRQFSVGVTGRDLSTLQGRVNLNDVLVPMLQASCPAA